MRKIKLTQEVQRRWHKESTCQLRGGKQHPTKASSWAFSCPCQELDWPECWWPGTWSSSPFPSPQMDSSLWAWAAEHGMVTTPHSWYTMLGFYFSYIFGNKPKTWFGMWFTSFHQFRNEDSCSEPRSHHYPMFCARSRQTQWWR